MSHLREKFLIFSRQQHHRTQHFAAPSSSPSPVRVPSSSSSSSLLLSHRGSSIIAHSILPLPPPPPLQFVFLLPLPLLLSSSLIAAAASSHTAFCRSLLLPERAQLARGRLRSTNLREPPREEHPQYQALILFWHPDSLASLHRRRLLLSSSTFPSLSGEPDARGISSSRQGRLQGEHRHRPRHHVQLRGCVAE